MQFQTQKKKTKARKLQSPNSDSNEDSGSKSKGSPNEEKNKQIYQNLLAQQCLGEDIFSMQPQFENLSNPLINPDGQADSTRMKLEQHSEPTDFFSNFPQTYQRFSNDINSSPSTIQTQSKHTILKYSQSILGNSSAHQVCSSYTGSGLRLNSFCQDEDESPLGNFGQASTD